MKNLPFRNKRKTVLFTRVFIVSITVFSLTAGSFPAPANAAVPTWVVLFDANTAFETSLETFMFDLFNTLQRRQEDFTAAFELQKIQKAREDVNKLFLETQEELQNYGQLIERSSSEQIRDPRFRGDEDFCNQVPSQYPGTAGCGPTISPLKDARIIHDPYQYLFGDAYTKAQLYTYCFFNYLIWDQRGWLAKQGGYEFLNNVKVGGINNWYNARKRTYDPRPSDPKGSPNNPPAAGVQRSINELLRVRNRIVAQMHRGNYYVLDYPIQAIYGKIGSDDGAGLNDFKNNLEPQCRQVMYTVGADNPITVEQNVKLWSELMTGNSLFEGLSPAQINAEVQQFRQSIWFLPSLHKNIANRAPDDPWTWDEFEKAMTPFNTIDGVVDAALSTAQRIIEETQEERKATYIAGQGLRPENLYVAVGASGGDAQFQLNTEYVIAPAVVLLQKMQAATQAMFDLAGQGFLYLDPDDSPSDLLAKYRLATTATQAAERRICNQAGSCALLDPWLKPAASFRTAASLRTSEGLGRPPTQVPALVGPAPDFSQENAQGVAGSGLPAPWEDYADFLNISNEKAPDVLGEGTPNARLAPDRYNTRRYTVARFRVFNRAPGEDAILDPQKYAGRDEFDIPGGAKRNFRDNIGWPHLGQDFPLNDWYDRVFEMYEPGIAITNFTTGDSGRISRQRDFTARDWQCYVAIWFFPRQVEPSGGNSFFIGKQPALQQNDETLRAYCGVPVE